MGRSSVGELFRRTARHPENFSDEDLAIFSANAATTAARRAMINYYRAMLRGGGANRSRKLGYPRIEVPTLLLWGEDDMALTKATTFGTEQHVADLTIRYLPGISHWVQQDAPETVNAMLRTWLTGQPVPEMTPERRSA
jgi:pimeloyl-ACP methyl ester carboxylesterase